ncbi:MAG: poly(R)-hydroxyalkanoic acid synthase subunit PhaE [Syntrophaceae bacterium]
MGQEKNTIPEMESMFSAWNKASKDYWDATNKIWSEAVQDKTLLNQGDVSQQLNSMWQAFAKSLNLPDSSSKGPDTGLDLFTKMIEPFWSAVLSSQSVDQGKETKADDLRTLTRQFSKNWYDLFDKEFRQVLNVPQLGLTRYYQEHAAKAVEKFNDFQAQVNKFVNLLCEPLVETTQVVRDEVKKAREGGEEIVKDYKAQYKLWINKLEASYLDLLKSPEYIAALSDILKSLRDYKVTRQQLLIDMLQDVPVPTHKDMDELYKEIYHLKKRVKELEKRGKKNG